MVGFAFKLKSRYSIGYPTKSCSKLISDVDLFMTTKGEKMEFIDIGGHMRLVICQAVAPQAEPIPSPNH